jgi:hypothetical protein
VLAVIWWSFPPSGWLDEGILAILPNHVYAIRDVRFNTLDGLVAVAAILILERAWRRDN